MSPNDVLAEAGYFGIMIEIFIKSRDLPYCMASDLESKLKEQEQFKSAGERKIAEVLNKYGIDFKYESPLVVTDEQGKQRIWYPDFCLPEYGIYLEFNGFEGNLDYDSGKMKKDLTYKKNGIELIGIEPGILNGQLENYLINRIYGIQKRRLTDIESKIYALRTGRPREYR